MTERTNAETREWAIEWGAGLPWTLAADASITLAAALIAKCDEVDRLTRILADAVRPAAEALHLADSSDYGSALWEVVRAADPEMFDLLGDGKAGPALFPENYAADKALEASDAQ